MKFFFYAFVIFSSALFASPQKRRLIIWSIDGFAAAYLTNPEFQKIKVWQRLLKRAQLFTPVETVIPALTYPAHTAMVTGHETANHRLYGNHPVDPFNESQKGWTWFTEDIHKKPLWDFAREQRKTVANIMWPVTMMDIRRIKYHIPQFDRAKGSEEIKLMRVLSTPGLYRDIERHTQISLTEHSNDIDRIAVGKYIWQKKKPDLMLLYTPGLDSIEHQKGAYSAQALAHLEDLGKEMEALLKVIMKPQRHETTALLIVSDHGFMTFEGICFPNAILQKQGYIDDKSKTWQHWFDTAGGVARLVSVKNAAPFDVNSFVKVLTKECPHIDAVDASHKDFSRLRKKYDTQSALFLVGRATTLMSASWQSKTIFNKNLTGHTHGFLPEREDMHTVALAFTPHKKVPVKIRYTKDTFRFACTYLRLLCK